MISTTEDRIFQDLVQTQTLTNDKDNKSTSLANTQSSDNNSTGSDATNNISTSRQSSQLVVFENDLEEIKDNLAEARSSLNQGNQIELDQHIDNIDRLLSIILMTNSTLTINP